jgi:hypothetical protein
MSRNYAELERQLIDDLKPRTGKDLAEWMVAIDAAHLNDRNAIIDWLRPQGFSFSNASWIERIHHNAGRPIYLDRAPHRRPERHRPKTDDVVSSTAAPPARSQPKPPDPSPMPEESKDSDLLKCLLANGKAYRPLAEMLLEDIKRALPGIVFQPRAGLISFSRPNEFAALSVTAKELRLGLDLGERPFVAPLAKAKLPGASAGLSHMLVLTDARQVDAALIKLVLAADARANPPPPEPDRHH